MALYKITHYFSLLFFLPFFFACQKDPETIIKTVTLTDTLIILKTDTIILKQYIEDSATTFILSRHTETTGIGADPSLSIIGQERATELARVLKKTPINAVYATNFNRTKETASRVATNYALSTQIYDPSKLEELVTTGLNQYHNQVLYIVGHSNTTNVLLNIMIGSNIYGNIPDTEYDNLYIVNVNSKGNAKVVHLKFGK